MHQPKVATLFHKKQIYSLFANGRALFALRIRSATAPLLPMELSLHDARAVCFSIALPNLIRCFWCEQASCLWQVNQRVSLCCQLCSDCSESEQKTLLHVIAQIKALCTSVCCCKLRLDFLKWQAASYQRIIETLREFGHKLQ